MTRLKFDVRNFDTKTREQLAWKVKNAKDFKLPRMTYWNYEPCRRCRNNGWEEEIYNKETGITTKVLVKDKPNPRCHSCGIEFMQHQRIAVAWLYLKKKALLADTPGVGKTFSAIGLLSMLYETGEIPGERFNKKAIFIPRSPALHQWRKQMIRSMPSISDRILLVDGSMTKQKRKQLYLGDWDVLLIGPEMFRNDFDDIEKVGTVELLVTDDIDSLRNRETDTSYFVDRMGRRAERFVIMTGSPLQKKLPELHCVLDGLGGESILGSFDTFVAQHVRKETVTETDQFGRNQHTTKIVGYRGVDKIKQKIAPLVLRRTAEDVSDARFPNVVVDDVFLEMYPQQRKMYKELQKEVITMVKEDGIEAQKKVQAIAKLHYGSAICAGMATLGYEDGPRTSVKYDWVTQVLGPGGDLENEKVVIFARLKTSIRALQRRFDNMGIKYVTVWGEETSKEARQRSQDQFWEDKETRVLLGTAAIEQSLNLQVARHLINVDMILNPERMTQLAGRIRRFGSEYSRVFVHNLLINDSQEERYLPLLEREAAIASYVWDEKNDLFEELSSIELMRLITG